MKPVIKVNINNIINKIKNKTDILLHLFKLFNLVLLIYYYYYTSWEMLAPTQPKKKLKTKTDFQKFQLKRKRRLKRHLIKSAKQLTTWNWKCHKY